MRLGRQGPMMRKGVKDFDEFLRNYKLFEPYECAIHFRASTAGAISKENAHPYYIDESTFLMHNGCFWNVDLYDQKMSDSWHFGQLIGGLADKLKIKPGVLLRDPNYMDLLRMGAEGQMLVFLDEKGFIIPNKHEWIEDDDGVLYSNFYGWNPPVGLWEKYNPPKKIKTVNMSSARKDEISDTTDKPDYGLGYRTEEEYINGVWVPGLDRKQLPLSLQDGYDPEEHFSNRDTLGTAEDFRKYADFTDMSNMSLKDMTELCCTEPSFMAEMIQKTLARMV